MAAINFPNNPTVNQEFDTGAGMVFIWNGSAWFRKGSPIEIDQDQGFDDLSSHPIEGAKGNEIVTTQWVKDYVNEEWEWEEVHEYWGADLGDYYYNGWSCALNYDGSIALIGIPGVTSNSGRSRALSWDESNWTSRWTRNGSTEDRAGSAVAITGDGRIMATARPRRNATHSTWDMRDRGLVETYYQTGTFPSISASFKQSISGSSRWDNLGKGLALAGNNPYILGIANRTNIRFYRGFANTNNWSYRGQISSLDTSTDGINPADISISGNTRVLAIGNWRYDGLQNGSGRVHIYTRPSLTNSEASWTLRSVIDPPPSSTSNYNFGYRCSLSDDGKTLVVGSRNGGIVSVYRSTDYINWKLVNTIPAPSNASSGRFGSGLAISGDGNVLLIAAPYQNTSYINSGAVYRFEKKRRF